jgi:molybdate transport system substrate-binding protein
MALFRVGLILFLLAHATSTLGAAEISVFCTDALAPSMRELVPQFEKASGHHVRTTFANAGTVAARLESGEPADLGIVLPPAWDRLRQGGRIDQAVRIVLGRVGIGAFTRSGADKPDMSTVDAFKRTILSARALAVRDPAQRSPVGTYMLALFERLMLAEVVKPKLVLTTEPPYREVISGEVDLGFSTMAEIAAEPRAVLVGPLPSDIQNYLVFVAAIPVGSAQRAITDAFLHFLASEPSKATLRSKGIDPE